MQSKDNNTENYDGQTIPVSKHLVTGQEKKLLTGRNLFQNKGQRGAPSVVIGWVVRGMESFKAEFVHPCLLSCS